MRLRNVYRHAHCVRTMTLKHLTCMLHFAFVIHALHDELLTAHDEAVYYAKLIYESRQERYIYNW
jgi:hypothetical protein